MASTPESREVSLVVEDNGKAIAILPQDTRD
jgi:hypothetical protein